jgi:hypothetical protein
MNATETALKTPSRQRRIKIASRIFRVLILASLVLPMLFAIVLLSGWVGALPDRTTLMLSPHQIYKWPFEIPGPVLALALARLGLYGFCVLVLNNLFRLYERGIFFSAKNVNYIRFLGYYLMIDWVVVYLLDVSPQGGEVVTVTFTKIFVGFLIIFIAWIMDEGRKIQEEQELTV